MFRKIVSLFKKTDQPLTFNDLPSELKLYILDFLRPPELCKIALVSKEWNILSSNDSLWKKFLGTDDCDGPISKKNLYAFIKINKNSKKEPLKLNFNIRSEEINLPPIITTSILNDHFQPADYSLIHNTLMQHSLLETKVGHDLFKFKNKKSFFKKPQSEKKDQEVHNSDRDSYHSNELAIVVHPDTKIDKQLENFSKNREADEDYYKEHPIASGHLTMRMR